MPLKHLKELKAQAILLISTLGGQKIAIGNITGDNNRAHPQYQN
jgi:hypothetical protein